jgi:hypothetical protein
VKKTTNVTNARLTLEFNAQGLSHVRVKPLKSWPINWGCQSLRRLRALTVGAAADRIGLAQPATSAAAIRATDVSISADSITQNGDRRRAANTAIPPEPALNPAH